jgi:hypothetical protein
VKESADLGWKVSTDAAGVWESERDDALAKFGGEVCEGKHGLEFKRLLTFYYPASFSGVFCIYIKISRQMYNVDLSTVIILESVNSVL